MFNSFPLLETRRFILRQLRPSDAQALFDCLSDDEVTRYYNLPSFTSIGQAEQIIDNMIRRFRNQESIRWGISRKQDDLILGTCGFTGWKYYYYQGEIGYELARPFWRQGVMTEALTAVLKFGFQQMDLNRVSALVIPGNVASIKLLEKLGFLNEGILREYGYWKGDFHDLHSFSLLKRDAPWNSAE